MDNRKTCSKINAHFPVNPMGGRNVSHILHIATCKYIENISPLSDVNLVTKTIMFIFLSPFLSLAGLYIPLSTSLDSPSEIFLFLIFPLEAFIGLSFFISLVTRLLNEVILFSHAIEGLVFGTILTTLINALLSYTVIFPVPFVTITMGSGKFIPIYSPFLNLSSPLPPHFQVGVKLTYLYIYMRSIKPLPSSRPLFLSCIKATASFVLCVVLGLGWAVGFWYIEDKRLKSGEICTAFRNKKFD